MPEIVTIETLVKDIGELSKKVSTEFASKGDLDTLTKKLMDHQNLASLMERRKSAHPVFGTQGNYEKIAGAIGAGLFQIGYLTDADCTSGDSKRKNMALEFKTAAAAYNSTDTGVGHEFLPVTIDPIIS